MSENKKMFKLENDKPYEDEKTSESNRMMKETMERAGFILEDPSDEPLKCGGVRLALCGVTLAATAFTGYWSIGMLDYSVFINTIASSRQEHRRLEPDYSRDHPSWSFRYLSAPELETTPPVPGCPPATELRLRPSPSRQPPDARHR
jgi:hypothetical protein